MLRFLIAIVAFFTFVIEFVMSVVVSFFTIFKICTMRYHARIQYTLQAIENLMEARKNEL